MENEINYTQANFDDYRENIYENLCRKMNVATTNNEFLTLFDGFNELEDYRDSKEKCKQCLDKLSFTNSDELLFLGQSYKKLNVSRSNEIGEKCIIAAEQWKQYNDDYDAFYSKYSSRPKLLTLWDKYSIIIIILGIITLLNGFAFYFGAVLIEFIIRAILSAIRRSSEEYKLQSEELAKQKQLIDSVIYDLRKRY